MPYSFRPFLEAVRGNWFEDEPLLRDLLDRYAAAPPADADDLTSWGAAVSGPLRELAEESARPENRPRLRRYDAHGRRVDRVVLPASTRSVLAEVEGRKGLGAVHGDPFLHYTRTYLFAQNGEAGVACSVGCTDGLVRILEALGDRPVHREALDRVRGSSPERVWHGAQFVTEIQGGSDVPANRTEAVRDGQAYRIVGQKWFCSNINADYFLVTARPEGAPSGGEGVGLFLVPARVEGAAGRNGHTVDRLKDKLGTRELATAEVTFRGARAYPVGPLSRGLPNLVRHVLVPSRFHCVLIAAASLRRARRIVDAYVRFRRAFGRELIEFPLVREGTGTIVRDQERALACLFGLLDLWERADEEEPAEDGEGGAGGTAGVDFRVLLSLCKTEVTRAATRAIHEAMMLLGGNGIEERFSPLPRLHRDAVIMETWEGPHNVLRTQALRDLRRFDVDAGSFLRRTCGDVPDRLVEELDEVVRAPDADEATVPFSALAPRIVAAFADRLLDEVR